MHTLPHDEIGVHLLLTPELSSGSIPMGASEALERLASDIARLSGCSCKAVHVREDHMHILLRCTVDETIARFIDAFIPRALETVRNISGRTRSFDFDDRIHVTLLPPWNIDLFTAFVRDQEHYHSTHSLYQELEEIFIKGAANLTDGARREILDTVH
jgi:REP element-mobilizing transposase RayT